MCFSFLFLTGASFLQGGEGANTFIDKSILRFGYFPGRCLGDGVNLRYDCISRIVQMEMMNFIRDRNLETLFDWHAFKIGYTAPLSGGQVASSARSVKKNSVLLLLASNRGYS